jgi:glutamate--cysteine ligase
MSYTLPYTEWLKLLADPEQAKLLEKYQSGLEREALRVERNTGNLASTPHPASLGSALSNTEITTDFAEAQLELITPPYAGIDQLLDFQTRLHAFTAQTMSKDELIWFQSMPPNVAEEKIQIAHFGQSHTGRIKEIYRRGLANRYGKKMQIISGIHYNYSFHSDFWNFVYSQVNTRLSLDVFISENYLGLMRNYLRHCWLLAYLFGAAPMADSDFIGRDIPEIVRNPGSIYGPQATSLRMSRLGYVNSNRCTYSINYNSVTEYLAGLYKAITSECPGFQRLGLKEKGEYLQLNTYILQIENEHYALIRPKQPPRKGERPFGALRNRGIEYVEVRALDVNPLEILGATSDQLHFVRLFLLYCLLDPNPPIGSAELELINENQHWIAIQGRKKNMRLLRPEGSIALQDWGNTIFEALEPLAAILDQNREIPLYGPIIERERAKLTQPDLTPSAKIIDDFLESGKDFQAWNLEKSAYHQASLEKIVLSDTDLALFRSNVENSFVNQKKIEAEQFGTDFEAYLNKYLKLKEYGLDNYESA